VDRRIRLRDIISMNAYWIGHSFMWNSLHPILLPVLMLSFTEEAKNTAYGLLTFGGLLIALFVQPLSGALSDLTRSRLGRRRPWVILGASLSSLWLFVIVLARRFWIVALGYSLLQLSSNIAHGPAQALIPDLVVQQQHGVSAGIKNLFEMLGVVLAASIIGHLMGSEQARPMSAVVLMVCMLAGAVVVTLVGVRETPTRAKAESPAPANPVGMHSLLRLDLRHQPAYSRLLLSRFLVLLGAYAVQSFALYYVRDVFGPEAPTRVVGGMMAAIGLSVAVTALPAGILSERWGRRPLSLFACAITALGLALLGLARDVSGLWRLGCLIGAGMGIFSSVNWAWATDLVPSAQAGKYLGLSNLATAGSAATSRLLGPGIDLLNARGPNAGYSALFVLATAVVLLGFVTTLRIPDGSAANRSGPARAWFTFGRQPVHPSHEERSP